MSETFAKINKKMETECDRIGNKIPYISEQGKYVRDWGEKEIAWWTNASWGGIMWQMYQSVS